MVIITSSYLFFNNFKCWLFWVIEIQKQKMFYNIGHFSDGKNNQWFKNEVKI